MGSRSKVKEKRPYMPEDGLILSEIAILSGDYFVIMKNMYSVHCVNACFY